MLGPDDAPSREDLDGGSLYAWLEARRGVRIAGGHEIIDAVAASAGHARALDVDVGAPLLVARRSCRAADGSPIEYAVVRYRPDRYRFHVDLARG